jgi:hypothetical protein
MIDFERKTWFWIFFVVATYLFFYFGGRYYLRENFTGTRFKNTREDVAQQIVYTMGGY